MMMDGTVLASWFRLKYPHVAMGALASSAPLLYFEGVTPPEAYYDHVTRDYWVTTYLHVLIITYVRIA